MWLYLPSSVAAPVTMESDSDLKELSQKLAQYVTSKGRHSPPQTWFRRLKQAFWPKLLSTLTLPLSEANSGAEKWICSIAGTPAKDFPLQERERGKEILAFYGLTSSASSTPCARDESSSKMSRGTCRWDCPQYSATWKKLVMIVRSASSARRSAALHTAASASSSSASWPTPMAHDSINGDARRVGRYGTKHGGRNLNDWAMLNWPTVTVHGNANVKGMSPTSGDGLETAAKKMWSTPTASDGGTQTPDGKRALNLVTQSKMWATPRASEQENRQMKYSPSQLAGKHGMSLAAQAASNWSTPQASDGEHGGPNMRHTSGDQALPGQVHASAEAEKLWTTPTTDTSERTKKYAQGGTALAMQVAETERTMWPTPNVPNGGRKPKHGMSATGMTPDGKKRQVGLENAVEMDTQENWPTPTNSMSTWGDVMQAKYAGTDPNRPDYKTANQNWDTPTANDAKNSTLPASQQKRDGLAGQMLDMIAGQQDSDSLNSAGNRPDSLKKRYVLNPDWTEVLIGIPVGWTQITELTD